MDEEAAGDARSASADSAKQTILLQVRTRTSPAHRAACAVLRRVPLQALLCIARRSALRNARGCALCDPR